jgi:hypothetical protein
MTRWQRAMRSTYSFLSLVIFSFLLLCSTGAVAEDAGGQKLGSGPLRLTIVGPDEMAPVRHSAAAAPRLKQGKPKPKHIAKPAANAKRIAQAASHIKKIKNAPMRAATPDHKPAPRRPTLPKT